MDYIISVVIPTHNRLSDLCKAIDSIFKQNVLPDEIIVVDDGSDEPVTKTVFDFAPKGLNCCLLRNESSSGVSYTRNRGVKASKGNYIAFLDDDDEFKSNKIQVIKEEIKKNPHVDLFYHAAEIHMVNEKLLYFSQSKVLSYEDNIFNKLLIYNIVGGTPMVVAKKSAFLSVGGFDESLPALEDYELWIRMASAGKNFKYIPSVLTKYNSVTKKKSVSKSIDQNEIALCFIEDKYAIYYNDLDKKEIKCHNAWKAKMKVHKALLNEQKFKALSIQFNQFLKSPNPKYLLMILAILFGNKFVFSMKAKYR